MGLVQRGEHALDVLVGGVGAGGVHVFVARETLAQLGGAALVVAALHPAAVTVEDERGAGVLRAARQLLDHQQPGRACGADGERDDVVHKSLRMRVPIVAKPLFV